MTTAPTTTAMAAVALRPSTGRRIRSALLSVLNVLGVLIVLVLLWQWATSTFPNVFFPTPLKIIQRAQVLFFGGGAETLFATPAITVDTAGTLSRVFVGFLLGALWGVVIGTAVGRSRAVRDTVNPVVEFLRSIPATATLPLFIILLSGEDSMRIVFIAYGVSWFVIINTASGVASVHATPIEMGRIFRISRLGLLLRIVLPAALPKIFAGLRIGFTAALLLAVVSEFLLATNGIGFRLVDSQTRFAVLDMWCWMLLLAVLGFLLNSILDLVEHRLLAWDRQARQNG